MSRWKFLEYLKYRIFLYHYRYSHGQNRKSFKCKKNATVGNRIRNPGTGPRFSIGYNHWSLLAKIFF